MNMLILNRSKEDMLIMLLLLQRLDAFISLSFIDSLVLINYYFLVTRIRILWSMSVLVNKINFEFISIVIGGMAVVSKQLKKSYLVSKQLKNRYLVSSKKTFSQLICIIFWVSQTFLAIYRVVFYKSLILKTPKTKFYPTFQFTIFLNTVSKQPEY